MKYFSVLCIFVILALAAAADSEGSAAESSLATKNPEKRGIYGLGYGLGGYGGYYGGHGGYYGGHGLGGYGGYGGYAIHHAVPYVGHGYYPYHGHGHGFYH
ncbi:hypothetical protein DOY81_001910 [Sarcophaga bullata]|nr:hypothetical protein DOY81_001910 [Sarcophaga bullata]